MFTQEIEAAARHLCDLEGIEDPDKMVQTPAEEGELSEEPAWHTQARRIEAARRLDDELRTLV